MTEPRNGGGAPPPTDDLRSTIAGALAESLAETPPAGEEAAARAPARRGRSSRPEPGSAGPAEALTALTAAGGESGETAETGGVSARLSARAPAIVERRSSVDGGAPPPFRRSDIELPQ